MFIKIFADTSKNLDFFINFIFRMTQLINKVSLLTSHALDFYIQFQFSLTQFTDCIFRNSLTSMYSDIDINYLQHLTPPTTQAGMRNNLTGMCNLEYFSGLITTCKQNACLWRSSERQALKVKKLQKRIVFYGKNCFRLDKIKITYLPDTLLRFDDF